MCGVVVGIGYVFVVGVSGVYNGRSATSSVVVVGSVGLGFVVVVIADVSIGVGVGIGNGVCVFNVVMANVVSMIIG